MHRCSLCGVPCLCSDRTVCLGCPDCIAREFVRRLKRSGNMLKKAELTHWPADLPGYTAEGQVQDDLLTGRRTGSFRG